MRIRIISFFIVFLLIISLSVPASAVEEESATADSSYTGTKEEAIIRWLSEQGIDTLPEGVDLSTVEDFILLYKGTGLHFYFVKKHVSFYFLEENGVYTFYNTYPARAFIEYYPFFYTGSKWIGGSIWGDSNFYNSLFSLEPDSYEYLLSSDVYTDSTFETVLLEANVDSYIESYMPSEEPSTEPSTEPTSEPSSEDTSDTVASETSQEAFLLYSILQVLYFFIFVFACIVIYWLFNNVFYVGKV